MSFLSKLFGWMKVPHQVRTGEALLARSLRGGAWLMAGSMTEHGLRFLRNIILARLLAPDAFGVMALVLSVSSLFQVLTGLGVKESIVQNPRGSAPAYLNGAWWLAFSRGALLYVLALITAPWLARFYDAPELARLLPIAFINVFAQGAISAKAYLAVKEMRYSKWVIIQHGGGAIGILTTLTLAFYLRGVWALVIGYAVEAVARCLLSSLICPFLPRWRFERQHLQTLFRFAAGMFGLPLLMLVYTEGSTFVLGKLCTKTELGIFAMALTLARVPAMFSGQFVDLLMPAFSEIQRQPQRVNEAILKITTLIALLGFPAIAFTAVYAKAILAVVYGSKYAAGGLVLTLLFANEMVCLCNVPLVTVYMAVGQPALLRRFSLIRGLLMVALLWPAIAFGKLTGAAFVPLTAMLVAFGFQLARLRTVTGLDIAAYLGVWRRGLFASLPLAVFWLATAPFFKSAKPLASLLGVGSVTAAVLLLSAYSTFRKAAIREYFWPFIKQA